MNKLALTGLLVIMAAAVLIVLPLVREGFWCDEALSIAIARDAGPVQLLHDVYIAESSPPLFHLLLAGWGRVFGWQEMPIKIFALCWGLLSMAGIAAAGWQMAGPAAGLLAGALALHSPLITSHLVESRSYGMSAALLMFGIAALWRGVDTDRRAFRATAAALFAMACWSHYVAFVAVGGCCACSIVMAACKREAFWRRIAMANALGAAAILPLIPMIARQAGVGLPYEPARSAANRLLLAAGKYKFALPRSNFAPPLIGATVLIIAAVLPLFFLRAIPDSLRRSAQAITLIAFYAIPIFVVFGPYGSAERYVLLGAATLCVLFSIIVISIGRAGGRTKVSLAFRAAVVLCFVLSIGNAIRVAPRIAAEANWSKSGARPLAAAADFRDSDVVLAAPELLSETISYYAPRPLVVGFTIWYRPQVPSVRELAVLWPKATLLVPQTIARLEEVIRTRHPSRVFLVSGQIGAGQPLFLDPPIHALLTALQARWSLGPAVSFPGRVESLVVWQLGIQPRSPSPISSLPHVRHLGERRVSPGQSPRVEAPRR